MRKEKKWAVAAPHNAVLDCREAHELSSALGISLTTAMLLVNRGYTTVDGAKSFLGKTEEILHDPFLMRDMRKAAERVADAVVSGEKIVIFGDYDVDGVTSVSSLYLYLSKNGADVSYYIPCRAGEGYGVSEGAIRKLAEDGCSLIITVDTGITAVGEVEVAKSLGVDVIVTDHHECHSELPDAVAVVNPRRPDCDYPFKELAGVGVVYKLLCAVESVLNPDDSMIDCVRRISAEYGDLVAIGTIADVMPVKDENRLIVSYGLELIENTERPGLCELIDATSADSKYGKKRKITASFIGFTVAPRINAAGRISSASIAVELFLAKDRETAAPIAKQLCDINRERQSGENDIVEEAYAKIAAEHDFENDPVIVLDDDKWHHGIIGIVASRITEKYNCPSILISFEGSENGEIGKGSGRSVKGLNLVDALKNCSDLLEKFGGHELAVGLTIKRENLDDFKKKLNEYAREYLTDVDTEPTLDAEMELAPDDITIEQANELYMLEPYGVSNPVPVFVMYDVPLYDTALVGGGKHTRLTLRIGQNYVNAMVFRLSLGELDLYPGDTVDVMFSLDVNEFRDQKSVQLIVKDVRLSLSKAREENADRALYRKLIDEPDSVGTDVLRSVVPTRDDFAAVYNILKHELRVEHEVFSMRALRHLLKSANIPVGYVKLKLILTVFDELGLLGVNLRESEDAEIYSFRYIEQRGKTPLESSVLYSSLKERLNG